MLRLWHASAMLLVAKSAQRAAALLFKAAPMLHASLQDICVSLLQATPAEPDPVTPRASSLGPRVRSQRSPAAAFASAFQAAAAAGASPNPKRHSPGVPADRTPLRAQAVVSTGGHVRLRIAAARAHPACLRLGTLSVQASHSQPSYTHAMI